MTVYSEMSEEELSEVVEESERKENFKALVEICQNCCAKGDFETAMEESLDALLRLSAGSAKIDILKASNVCDMVPLALQNYQEEAAIIEVLFGLIRNLSKSEEMRTSLGRHATLIVKCMNEHSDGEATLQEMACLAIEAMCCKGHLVNAGLMQTAGAPICLENVSRPSITNERNLTYPDRALKAIRGL